MIERLSGLLIEKKLPYLIVDVNGIGYELKVPIKSTYDLVFIKTAVILYTHLIVKPDEYSLYGFLRKSDRSIFRELINYGGIGPNLALSILSSVSVDTLKKCIKTENIFLLKQIPGIGKKKAERLILELKDRFQKLPGTQSNYESDADAINALISLGIKKKEACLYVNSIATQGLSSEEIIKQALNNLLKT